MFTYLRHHICTKCVLTMEHVSGRKITGLSPLARMDLGMVGHTTPTMQADLIELLLAISEGKGDREAPPPNSRLPGVRSGVPEWTPPSSPVSLGRSRAG